MSAAPDAASRQNGAPIRPNRAAAWLVYGLAALCGGLAVAVLVGWFGERDGLSRLLPAWPPMHLTTALCFLAMAVGLAFAVGRNVVATCGFAGLAMLMAGASLALYLAGSDFNPATLLDLSRRMASDNLYQRISPLSAILFLMGGFALISPVLGKPGGTLMGLARPLTVLMLIAVGVVLGGHSAAITGDRLAMAPSTVIGLVLLTVGIGVLDLRYVTPHDRPSALSWTVVVAIAGVMLTLGNAHAVVVAQRDRVATELSIEAGHLAHQVQLRLAGELRAIERQALRWEVGQGDASRWTDDARAYVRDESGLEALFLADAGGRIEQLQGSPADGAVGIGSPLTALGITESEIADSRGRAAPTMVGLEPGAARENFYLLRPLFLDGVVRGYLVAEMNFAAEIADLARSNVRRGQAVSALVDDVPVFQTLPDGATAHPALSVESARAIGGRRWSVRLQATDAATFADRQRLGTVALAGGALTTLGAMAIAYMAARLWSRAGEIATANRGLGEVNRQLEAFSYAVSHDLRAPLRAMSGFAEALAEDYGDRLDETGHRYLERIRTAAETMGRLISDILALSRISRASVALQRVNLSEVAAECVETLRAGDPTREVEVRIQPGLVVWADLALARVLLSNLLGNAWKFTRDAQPARIVVTTAAAPHGLSGFAVRDNGCGFDMGQADKLFAPFQRLHAETDYEGTGVGLATVARVVNRLGGQVGFDAAPGRGATFMFALPTRPPTGKDHA